MKFPIEMYKIREENVTIKVPCECCFRKGIIDKKCNKCGGNGIHDKTIKVWRIAPKTEIVERIDRSPADSYHKEIQTTYAGGLRYWIGYSKFFNEEDKLLHFNKNDAQKECDRRNVGVENILKIYIENKKHEAFEEFDKQMETMKLMFL